MSIADFDKPQTVVPIKQATSPLSDIAYRLQKLVFADMMTLTRGIVEGDLTTDVGIAEALLEWARSCENPEQSK